jgi:hypothetical protein
MKIRPVGAELFHADVQTDMAKLIVAFRNIANAPKKASTCTEPLAQRERHILDVISFCYDPRSPTRLNFNSVLHNQKMSMLSVGRFCPSSHLGLQDKLCEQEAR